MVSKTNEQAFEAAIEKALTGNCLEELAEYYGSRACIDLWSKTPFFNGFANNFNLY